MQPLIEQLENRLFMDTTITSGGTYSGALGKVTVNTTAAVTIANATLTGVGNLLTVNSVASLTVRDSVFTGQAGAAGSRRGRAISFATGYLTFTAKRVQFINTAGVDAYNPRSGSTLSFTHNTFRNVIGQRAGRTGNSDTGTSPDLDLVQAIQLNGSTNLSADIGWNEIVNEKGKSRVEDNVSVWNSSGTAAKPIWIHDNYITGAYPWQYAANVEFSGGGIIVDGQTPAYVLIENNTVRNTQNYAVAIAGGSNVTVRNNNLLCDELLSFTNVLLYTRNYYTGPFTGNVVTGNRLKSINNNLTWNLSTSGVTASNNTSFTGPGWQLLPDATAMAERDILAWAA